MMQSEADFLALIDRHFPNRGPKLVVGRGDDCAVVKTPGHICVTTDLFLQDVHFRLDYFTPQEAGYKALAVNVSDVLSMGALPVGFTLDLFGPLRDEAFWSALLGSMSALAGEYDLALVGGDLSRANTLGICATVWGEAASPHGFVRRGTARPGDELFALGELGLARVGLCALEEAGRERAMAEWPEGCRAHLTPGLPRRQMTALLDALAPTAMMDLSDGLARDLPRLLAPGQGARLTLTSDDLSTEVIRYAKSRDLDPVEFAVLGGEDYALLVAAAPEDGPRLQAACKEALHLGTVRDRQGITLGGRQLAPGGFDHFDPA